jgi:dTDP-4-amino-4,6-dideoxygalactose transaminase
MSELAIKGGTPVRKAPFHPWPYSDEREIEAVNEVIRSGKWWRWAYATGVEMSEEVDSLDTSKTVQFGRKFAAFQDAQYGLATANGSGSLDMIFKALGIGPGDEVIVPAISFVASATAPLQVNAVPIFVDVEADTNNINPDLIEDAITDRTKAIEVVHFGGQPCDMDKILAIAEKHHLFVVEDAAHAHGSEWRGKKVGALGTAGSFSFQQAKNMTAGEGGIIVTNNHDVAEICDSLIWSGRVKGRPWYEFHRLGWNYRMTEMQAAILLVQLERLEEQNARRMVNFKYLAERLSEVPGIMPLRWDERTTKHSCHIFMARYDSSILHGIDRIRYCAALEAEGIPVGHGYTHPLYANPMFVNQNFYTKGCPISCGFYNKPVDYAAYKDKCPVAENVCYREAIWLQHRFFLGSRQDMDNIADAFAKVALHIDDLADLPVRDY